MTRPLTLPVLLGAVLFASCGNEPTTPDPSPDGRSFLDEKRTLQASQEWNREIVCARQGEVKVAIKGEGPMGITIVPKEAWEAMMKGDKETARKIGLTHSEDTPGPDYKRIFMLEQGSYYIIIENQRDAESTVLLQCFDL